MQPPPGTGPRTPPVDHVVEATTEGAGQTVDQDRGRIFPCPGCGADLEFHIGRQNLRCPYCGMEKTIDVAEDAAVEEQDYRAMLARLAEMRKGDAPESTEAHEVRCGSCGANVAFQGTLTSTECAFCGSPIQRENVHTASTRVAVDGVLAFQVDMARARINLGNWVKSRWFAPGAFKRRGVKGHFNGVYLPFWTYDALTFNRFRGERGEHHWVTVGSGKHQRRERRTRWHAASGTFEWFFDDILVVGARGLPPRLMRKLEPWPLHRCVPFDQKLLAGHLAQTYDLELDEGFREARDRMEQVIQREVRAEIGGDDQRVHAVETRCDPITYKHLLLPVWLLAYRYGERSFQVVVNAGTGEVQGERPVSLVKVGLAVLGALVVAGAAALMFAGR